MAKQWKEKSRGVDRWKNQKLKIGEKENKDEMIEKFREWNWKRSLSRKTETRRRKKTFLAGFWASEDERTCLDIANKRAEEQASEQENKQASRRRSKRASEQ